jgi:thimet oligopeptidase
VFNQGGSACRVVVQTAVDRPRQIRSSHRYIELMVPLELPTTTQGWFEFLAARCDDQLRLARDSVELLVEEPRDVGTILARWNGVTLALLNATSAAILVARAHPEAAVRVQAEQAEQAAITLDTQVRQDRRIYDTLRSIDPEHLDHTAARVLTLTLRDFRRAGVDLDDSKRGRLGDLVARCTALAQQFEANVTDTRTVSVNSEQLDGLPDDYVAAHPPGDDGRVTVRIDYPDVLPFMRFAHDAEARRAVETEFDNRGWPANDAVLRELLELRAERARLLGYDGWADYDAEVKMVGSSAGIRQFHDRVAATVAPAAREDMEELNRRLRRDHSEATEMTWADFDYYREVVRRERFDVDASEVRRYLDCSKVVQGLLDVAGRLFGLEFLEVPDAPAWHPDVRTYDVVDAGELIGRFHLDLHPRPGKFTLGGHFALTRGLAGVQLPQSALLVNVSTGLIEHGDVVVLFHEFGHLLHSLLGGQVTWARDSGVATERDFVEAPSQMLEEWAYDPDVLRSFATDDDGHPIPAELVERMRVADEFCRGCDIATQLGYSEVAFALHEEVPDDVAACAATAFAKHSPIQPLPGTHWYSAFTHLADERYGSGYYAYLWSLVISKDLFSAFDPTDLMAAGPARRYRDLVLSPGGSRDGAELVTAFLGRPVSTAAFDRWLAGA